MAHTAPVSFTTQGIVLRTQRLGEGDQLICLFSPDRGLLKCVVKGGLSIRRKQASPLAPLVVAEWVLRTGRSELHHCLEARPQQRLFSEVASYSQLAAGCLLAQAILRSQLLEKPVPDLYRLFFTYLQVMQRSSVMEPWVCSFWLKLLRHEGLLDSLSVCIQCQTPSLELYLERGESCCPAHAASGALRFSSEERQLAQTLRNSRSLAEIAALQVSETFYAKVKQLFEGILRSV